MGHCSNMDCRAEFSLANQSHTCVYCGKEFCSRCIVKRGEFRKEDCFCRDCYATIEKKILGKGETRDPDLKDKLKGTENEKDKPEEPGSCVACGKTFGAARPPCECIFCGNTFCHECLVFEGEFRRSDHFCPECVNELANAVILTSEDEVDGSIIEKVIRPISSLKYRTRELTEFFLKWQARALGANAIISYKTAESLDGQKIIGAGTALVLKNGAKADPKSESAKKEQEKKLAGEIAGRLLDKNQDDPGYKEKSSDQ